MATVRATASSSNPAVPTHHMPALVRLFLTAYLGMTKLQVGFVHQALSELARGYPFRRDGEHLPVNILLVRFAEHIVGCGGEQRAIEESPLAPFVTLARTLGDEQRAAIIALCRAVAEALESSATHH